MHDMQRHTILWEYKMGVRDDAMSSQVETLQKIDVMKHSLNS
jgi:hypothetical protein